MKLYRSSAAVIKRRLAKAAPADRAAVRLALDLADILTGPTCLATATRLAEAAARDPRWLAVGMLDAAERYFATEKKRATRTIRRAKIKLAIQRAQDRANAAR